MSGLQQEVHLLSNKMQQTVIPYHHCLPLLFASQQHAPKYKKCLKDAPRALHAPSAASSPLTTSSRPVLQPNYRQVVWHQEVAPLSVHVSASAPPPPTTPSGNMDPLYYFASAAKPALGG